MMAIGVFVFGVIIGSFLNVVIYRVPKKQSISLPASHCQSCNTPLAWWHNIPLISWIILRGECFFCHAPISKRYFFVELATGIIFVLIYFKLGFVWHLPFVWATFAALFALSMIDFDYMAVPDSINIIALIFALVQPDFLSALLYGAIAAIGLYSAGWIASKLAKKEAMGGADVIVAGTMGALLGFPLFFIAIFISAILALVPALVWRDKGVPFVPFLSLATLLVYLYEAQFLEITQKVIYG